MQIFDINMSEHGSNNSNADMEVIDAADLEDSPPPADEKEVENNDKQVEESKDVIESKVGLYNRSIVEV